MYSSLFGGIPLGISKNASLVRKFDYDGGSDDLSMLLKLAQDTDAQTAVQWYKENTGVDVLASEVNYALKDPIRLQRYLQNQQSGAKLRNLYETRNLQIEDAIDSYLDVLQKGKYDKYGQTYELGPELAGFVGLRSVKVDPERALDLAFGRSSVEQTSKSIYRGITQKSFNLGWKISNEYELSKIKANMDKGLLKITIPLSEKKKPKLLDVKIE